MIMTISHVHCHVKDLPGAVAWFTTKFEVVPTFSDARMAVLPFGAFTLILDSAGDDSIVTVGFNSSDCQRDFESLVARDAQVVTPPQDRPYGARVAYVQGPGRLTIEIEQVLSQTV